MKANFSNKTRRTASLLVLVSIMCSAMPVNAQYYINIWNGPKAIGINAGLSSFVSKAQYSYDASKITAKEQSITPIAPTVGLNYSIFDYYNDIIYGTDYNINYVGFQHSHTFQDAHTYETTIQRKALDLSIQLFVGYNFSESFNVCLKAGFSDMLNLSNRITQKVDGTDTKTDNVYVRDIYKGTANGFFIPITLSATYLFTEHWFVRGSLVTELINASKEHGTLYFNNEPVIMTNSTKNISLVATFGFTWE